MNGRYRNAERLRALRAEEKLGPLTLDRRCVITSLLPAALEPWPGSRLARGRKRCEFAVVNSLPGQGGDEW